MYTTKAFLPKSKVAVTNFFWLIIYTRIIVGKALTGMYDLQISFCSTNNMSSFLRVKKSIFKITSILLLVSRNVS